VTTQVPRGNHPRRVMCLFRLARPRWVGFGHRIRKGTSWLVIRTSPTMGSSVTCRAFRQLPASLQSPVADQRRSQPRPPARPRCQL